MHELDYTLHGCYVFSFHIQKSVLQKKEAVAQTRSVKKVFL